MVDGSAMDIDSELTRRVDAGDDLMGRDDDDEWMIEEDGLSPVVPQAIFDYEKVLRSERCRLAALRPRVKHTDWSRFERTRTGYIGLSSPTNVPPSIIPRLDDALAMTVAGATMKVVNWDGKSPLPIVGHDDRVIAVGAPRPPIPDWDNIHERASKRILTFERATHLRTLAIDAETFQA